MLFDQYQLKVLSQTYKALDFILDFKLDIVLLDIIIIRIDGRETYKSLKNNPLLQVIPMQEEMRNMLILSKDGSRKFTGAKYLFQNVKATFTRAINAITSTIDTIHPLNAWPELIQHTPMETAMVCSQLLMCSVNNLHRTIPGKKAD